MINIINKYLHFSLHQILFKYDNKLDEWCGNKCVFLQEPKERKPIYKLIVGVTGFHMRLWLKYAFVLELTQTTL